MPVWRWHTRYAMLRAGSPATRCCTHINDAAFIHACLMRHSPMHACVPVVCAPYYWKRDGVCCAACRPTSCSWSIPGPGYQEVTRPCIRYRTQHVHYISAHQLTRHASTYAASGLLPAAGHPPGRHLGLHPRLSSHRLLTGIIYKAFRNINIMHIV